MKKNTKRTIILGVVCTLLIVAASWYTITFNDSRHLTKTKKYLYSIKN